MEGRGDESFFVSNFLVYCGTVRDSIERFLRRLIRLVSGEIIIYFRTWCYPKANYEQQNNICLKHLSAFHRMSVKEDSGTASPAFKHPQILQLSDIH